MAPASEFRTRDIGLSIHDAWYVSHRVDYHCRDSFVSHACSQSRDLRLFFASTGTSFCPGLYPTPYPLLSLQRIYLSVYPNRFSAASNSFFLITAVPQSKQRTILQPPNVFLRDTNGTDNSESKRSRHRCWTSRLN